MSSVQHLREFISARLTAAAEEIFSEFEKTIEEEIDRQRRLLDISWRPQIKLHRTDVSQQHVNQQLDSQEKISGSDQEELLSTQREEQLPPKEEADTFMWTPIYQGSDFIKAEPITEQLHSNNSSLTESNPTCLASAIHAEMMPQNHENGSHNINVDASLVSDCGKTFRDEQHHRIHAGLKLHSCEICGKSFAKSGILSSHRRTHTGEKPFSCETCWKNFNQRSYLSVHMRIHTGEWPYSCRTCGKSFTFSSSLNVHMRTHTGEKAFSCQRCGKCFRQNIHLLSHMRVHAARKRGKNVHK